MLQSRRKTCTTEETTSLLDAVSALISKGTRMRWEKELLVSRYRQAVGLSAARYQNTDPLTY